MMYISKSLGVHETIHTDDVITTRIYFTLVSMYHVSTEAAFPGDIPDMTFQTNSTVT